MNPERQKKRRSATDIATQLQAAQLTLVESLLVGFVEQIEGHVPSEDEILQHGEHVTLAPGPISVFEKDGKRFSQFYCWRSKHVIALGFLDTNNLLELYHCLVAEEDWPAALRLHVNRPKDSDST